MPEDPEVLDTYDIPTHDETQYLIVTDPELTTTDVQVWHKRNAAAHKDRRRLSRQFDTTILLFDFERAAWRYPTPA